MRADVVAMPRPAVEQRGSPVADAIAPWVLRAGAFLLPLAFLPNIVDEFVLPKLLLVRLLVFLFMIVLLIRWLETGEVAWRRTPLDLPLLAFIGSAALSTVFAVNSNVAVFGTYDRWEGLLTITTYALLFWLAVQLLSGEADARGLTWSLLFSGYIIGVAAVLQGGFGLLGGGYFREGPNGPIRADVTLANPDFLGIFFAMLLPVAFAKVISRRPALTRVLAANLVIVLAIGLLLTFTRAAWIGAVIGVIVVITLRRGRIRFLPLVASAASIVLLVGILAAVSAAGSQGGFAGALYKRVVSIADLSSGTEATRIRTWGDTLPLIASRPIFGYGPDTFGLVYPKFQTVNKHATLWDKPHEETLGVGAAQGIIGLLAYIWILVAFVRAFWSGRSLRGAVALFGGWVAYQIGTQFNFSYIPTSAPFWLFAAAAIVMWAPNVEPARVRAFPRRLALPALVAGSAVLAIIAVPAIVFPYVADVDYYAAQASGDLGQARSLIAEARALAPFDATYAVQAGDFALNPDSSDIPATDADWAAAREAYSAAARLGSYAPETFRHLAIVDEHFGDHAGAVAAAQRAVELDRFDPDSRALLARLSGQ